ncbi:MAG: BTAD domain-containing putative transcriptional regulator [bacterium]|nr:BTAD domain-containing putative transcriptional regulator [bacterium]
MQTHAPTLIRRKIQVPVLPEEFVPRPAALAKLARGLDPAARLTLVSAGPGYGKSTTVASYVYHSGVRHAWVALEAWDADIPGFMKYLVGSLDRALGGGVLPRSLERLATLDGDDRTWRPLVDGLIEELAYHEDEPLIWVLDDFHAVQDNPAIRDVVAMLVSYLPERFQLVLVSRHDPDLPLPMLRVRRQLVEVGITDLRFEAGEAIHLVSKLSGRDWSQREADELVTWTDGWAATLVLAAQQPPSTNGLSWAASSAFDYLAEEVFSRQDPVMQDFLLGTAHLGVVEPATCRDLGFEEPQTRIRRLRAMNLLLRLDEADTGAYHPIFETFLRVRARETWASDRHVEHLRRAAGTLRHRRPEMALECAVAAEDDALAIAILREMAPVYLAEARHEALNRALGLLPGAWHERSPWPHQFRAESARLTGRMEASLASLETAERLARAGSETSALGWCLATRAACLGSRGDARARELAREALGTLGETEPAARAFAWNVTGMMAQMAHEIREARDAFEQAGSLYRQAGDALGESKVQHNLGLLLAREGDFERAAATYRESIRLASSAGRRAHAATHTNLATLHMQLTEYEAAWQEGETALALADQAGSPRDTGWTRLTLGMTAARTGQLAIADEHFEATGRLARDLGDRPLAALALVGQADLARTQGQLERARELLDRAVAHRDLPLEAPGMIDFQVAQGLLWTASGEFARARHILDLALETCRHQGYRFREAVIAAYLARACEGEGHPAAGSHREWAKRLCREHRWPFPAELEGGGRETAGTPPRGPSYPTPVEPEVPGARLVARCFGPFEVETPDGVIPARQWQGSRTRLVLAYLLHHPDGVTREQLSALVYGEEEVSRAAILMILSRLRQALEPDLEKQAPSRYIAYQGGRYVFNTAVPVDLDVREVGYRLDQARQTAEDPVQTRRHLEAALLRYRGRFLTDLTEWYWVQTVQENWHQRILAAHDQLFALLERDGDDEAALAWADRLIAVDRCAETAYRVKMRILAARGQRPSAMRLFRQLEEVLSTELGVEPDPESRALAASLGT